MSLHPPTPEEMSSSGSGTGLSPVAVNGASHAAVNGELCQCNYTSTGAVAIQLPTGTVGVVDSGGAALSGSHPITVTAPAGYTFLSGGGSTFVIGLGATLPEFAADDCSATFVTNSTTMKVEVSAGLLVLGTMASQNAGAVAITGGTATGLTVDGVTPAQMDILANGAKSTVAVTMNAFNTWADGQTIVLPTIGSHTLKVTTTGDIDIVGLGEAAAKAAIAAYLTAHAGATCAVTVVGTSATMTVTALAYGTTLNGSVVSGTMLAASGTMAAGANPISAAKEAALDAVAAGVDVPASGVVGTFTGGAASIAPGTDNASRYPIAAARTLSQASALTLATTGSPVVGNKIIACYALSLGYVLSIVNGGPLANTLATFGATLSAPLGVVVYWDGTNYKFNGYVCLS